MPSLSSKNKNFAIVVRNYAEILVKAFCSCPIWLDFFTFFKILLFRIVEKNIRKSKSFIIFKKLNLNSYDPLKTVFITVITLEKLDY